MGAGGAAAGVVFGSGVGVVGVGVVVVVTVWVVVAVTDSVTVVGDVPPLPQAVRPRARIEVARIGVTRFMLLAFRGRCSVGGL